MAGKTTYTSAKKRANSKWDSINTRQIKFKFMLKSDSDILARLDTQQNKAEYIRRLIREDIAREQQK